MPAGPILRTFVQYLLTFCSRPEAASDAVSSRVVEPIVLDKWVKFNGPSLNRSIKISPEAAGGGIFDICFAITADQN